MNTNIIKICLLGLALAFSLNSTYAFEATIIKEGAKLNLSDCIRIALDNSPNIKKAVYNYKISKNDVSLAKTDFFPTLNLNTGY